MASLTASIQNRQLVGACSSPLEWASVVFSEDRRIERGGGPQSGLICDLGCGWSKIKVLCPMS